MRILLLRVTFGFIACLVLVRKGVICEVDTVTDSASDDVDIVEDLDATDAITGNDTSADKDDGTEPVQSGPLIDLLGTKMESLEMNADGQSAQVKEHFTNEALSGKKVIGLYFSADWCGPCRSFTPELVSFYERMNNRRGRKNQFEIVWISRCRDVDSHYKYFSHMKWLAMPRLEASGELGQKLGERYGVRGIPSLVLIDDLGATITTDARNKIPADKAGIGFPWRNPISQIYNTLVPRSLRMMVKLQIDGVKNKFFQRIRKILKFK